MYQPAFIAVLRCWRSRQGSTSAYRDEISVLSPRICGSTLISQRELPTNNVPTLRTSKFLLPRPHLVQPKRHFSHRNFSTSATSQPKAPTTPVGDIFGVSGIKTDHLRRGNHGYNASGGNYRDSFPGGRTTSTASRQHSNYNEALRVIDGMVPFFSTQRTPKFLRSFLSCFWKN